MRELALMGLMTLPLGFSLLHSGCSDLPPNVVSISPTYGWEDGCQQVKVSGHGFTEDVEITVGGEPLANLTQPNPDENPLDVGFVVYGTTPSGQNGFADVAMDADGLTDQSVDAFYYVACPSSPYIEGAEPSSDLIGGEAITLEGCSIDPGAVSVRVGASADISLTSVCGTASAYFSAPALEDGYWYAGFFDSNGDQVAPSVDCDITQEADPPDTGYYQAYYPDTADPCYGALILNYGGE